MSPAYKPNIHARGEHVELISDIVVIIILTLCLLFQRWILLKTTMRPFAIRMMGYKNNNLDEDASQGVEKFCKYGWHFIVYIMLFCWGVWLLSESEWSVLSAGGRLDNVWVGYPHTGREKMALKAFYMAQISWYVHGLVELVMIDRSRSDFVMMLFHHFLAIALLCGSFWGNAHRVGLTVCVVQVQPRFQLQYVSPCGMWHCWDI